MSRRLKERPACKFCGKKTKWLTAKFCSTSCQLRQRGRDSLQAWLDGNHPGYTGKTKLTCQFVKTYLFEKHGRKCSDCGWDKINSTTGVCPVEIDHIDGNAENCKEGNLKIVCPNCHSLTSTFRNLNKGRGKRLRRLSDQSGNGLVL